MSDDILRDRDRLAVMFEYLDALRDSGVTNMFGASAYLAREHGLGAGVARAVLAAWMKSFDSTVPPDWRAETFIAGKKQ